MIVVGVSVATGEKKHICLASNSQLSHKVGCDVKERVWAGHLLFFILKALADRMPLRIAGAADDVLVPIAFEVDHIIVFLQLVQLDIDENPDTVRNGQKAVLLCCR